MESSFIQSILIGTFIGVASGSIGSFVLLRRMALVSDALSHVALPGIALALAYHVDPFWGVLGFLLIAAMIVWRLEMKTKLPTEAIVGLLFTASLAVGILIIPDKELMESLFGTFPALSPILLAGFVMISGLVSVLIFNFTKKFVFMTVSPELAAVEGIRERYQLFLLLIFAFVVALGIKIVGTLLMGALIIISALIAKNIARNMKGYIMASSLVGGFVAMGGVASSKFFGYLPGPTVILFGILLFFLSVPFKRTGRIRAPMKKNLI